MKNQRIDILVVPPKSGEDWKQFDGSEFVTLHMSRVISNHHGYRAASSHDRVDAVMTAQPDCCTPTRPHTACSAYPHA
jgi:hypothetical protein